MTMAHQTCEKDLPMSTNISEIIVRHFVLDLTCQLKQRKFEGSVMLFSQPALHEQLQPTESDHSKVNTPTTTVKSQTASSCSNSSEEASCPGSYLSESLQTDNIHQHINGVVLSNAYNVKNDSASGIHSVNKSDSQILVNTKRKLLQLVLDCHELDIQRVISYNLCCESSTDLKSDVGEMLRKHLKIEEDGLMFELPPSCFLQKRELNFMAEEHCLKIFAEDSNKANTFPSVIQIWYSTKPEGPSLSWTTDQDGQPCVFTVGHLLSNRSLFPSQDSPSALSSWQASVTVDENLSVLMTGDHLPTILTKDSGRRKFCYATSYPMPSSTFALAIGSWKMEEVVPVSVHELEDMSVPPIRLIFPECLREITSALLQWYLPRCFLNVQALLGVYPFHRLDVLIVPACFDSLGMARCCGADMKQTSAFYSPSLLFLSQSVLCPDHSMCVRVAHELCHTWFGLITGPLDWTEEWLTEGFCTYLEDILHAQVCEMGTETESYMDLRAELHLRLLKGELSHTDDELQTLRPNRGENSAYVGTGETCFLKNGMNTVKVFMQVHYLKGYFLLHELEHHVGRNQFLSFLRKYLQKFAHKLVTSQDFLNLFFETFPDVRTDAFSVDTIYSDWLDHAGLPKVLMSSENGGRLRSEESKKRANQIAQQLAQLKDMAARAHKRKRKYEVCKNSLATLEKLEWPVQIMLLFDQLLEEENLTGGTLDLLKEIYHRHFENAEVFHRWCELVIKHKRRKYFSDVRDFWMRHQAMGVYLYGEAMISEDPDITKMARDCFRQLQHDMPASVRETVSSMLFPS